MSIYYHKPSASVTRGSLQIKHAGYSFLLKYILILGILNFISPGISAKPLSQAGTIINRFPKSDPDTFHKAIHIPKPLQDTILIKNTGDKETEDIDRTLIDFRSQVEFDPVICYDLTFCSSKFEKGLFAKGIRFRNVDFSHTNLDSTTINFEDAHFGNWGDFSFILTDKLTSFQFLGASLPDVINFSCNPDVCTVNFTNADFEDEHRYSDDGRRWHYINLYASDISKVKLDYEHFRLCFFKDFGSSDKILSSCVRIDTACLIHFKLEEKSGETDTVLLEKIPLDEINSIIDICEVRDYLHDIFPFGKTTDTAVRSYLKYCLYTGYFPKRLTDDETVAIYENLLKNFQLNGQTESYENLDVEYKDWDNGLFILPHWWYYYGYRKWYIFIWTVFTLLVFTGLTYGMFERLNKPVASGGTYFIKNIPTDYQLLKDSKEKSKSKWIRKYRLARINQSFWYTGTVFFLLSLKLENLNFRGKYLYYIILMYSVGLLSLGYLANFVLQK